MPHPEWTGNPPDLCYSTDFSLHKRVRIRALGTPNYDLISTSLNEWRWQETTLQGLDDEQEVQKEVQPEEAQPEQQQQEQ